MIKLTEQEYKLLEKKLDKRFRKLNSIIKQKLIDNNELVKNDVSFILKKLDKKFLLTNDDIIKKLQLFLNE